MTVEELVTEIALEKPEGASIAILLTKDAYLHLDVKLHRALSDAHIFVVHSTDFDYLTVSARIFTDVYCVNIPTADKAAMYLFTRVRRIKGDKGGLHFYWATKSRIKLEGVSYEYTYIDETTHMERRKKDESY